MEEPATVSALSRVTIISGMCMALALVARGFLGLGGGVDGINTAPGLGFGLEGDVGLLQLLCHLLHLLICGLIIEEFGADFLTIRLLEALEEQGYYQLVICNV